MILVLRIFLFLFFINLSPRSQALPSPSFYINCDRVFRKYEHIDVDKLLVKPWEKKALASLTGLAGFSKINALVEKALERNKSLGHGPGKIFQDIETIAGFKSLVLGRPENLPTDRPIIFVANHPRGVSDGIQIMSIAENYRPDTKLLANQRAKGVETLANFFIGVSKGKKDKDKDKELRVRKINKGPLIELFRHLKDGGSLAMCPAGDVSRVNPKTGIFEDLPWSPILGTLIERFQPVIVPVYFHPTQTKNRTILEKNIIPAEIKKATALKAPNVIVIGDPIDTRTLQIDNAEEMTRYFQNLTYKLKDKINQ